MAYTKKTTTATGSTEKVTKTTEVKEDVKTIFTRRYYSMSFISKWWTLYRGSTFTYPL